MQMPHFIHENSESVSIPRDPSEEFVFITMAPEKQQQQQLPPELVIDIDHDCPPAASPPPPPAQSQPTVTTPAEQPGSLPRFREWIQCHAPEIPDLPIPFLKKFKKKRKKKAGSVVEAQLQSTKRRKRADETLYHTLPINTVIDKFGTNTETGLTSERAAQLLQQHGRNELAGQEGPHWLKVLGKQFLNGLTLILLIALGVSAGLQQWIEVGVIAFIVASNTIIGFQQEYKAESTMASLRNLSAPKALVLRDGNVQEVPAAEIVVGDIVVLKQGNVVPADLRLIKSKNLHIDESLLTGESEPVEKIIRVIEDESVGLGDRKNMAFMSTPVTKGSGRGITIATGMNSEVGEIAKKIAESDKGTSTPLTRRLNQMAYVLFAVAIVLSIIVLAVNSFDFSTEVVLYAVSIAIAMIPEGLVAVVTITMALSVRKMTNLHALVRRLNTLEALGAVTDICSDKTGTLTQARMVASELWTLPGTQFKVSGTGFESTGSITVVSSPTPQEINISAAGGIGSPLKEMMLVSSLCNNAICTKSNSANTEDIQANEARAESEASIQEEPKIVLGEPTEIALQILAHKVNMSKELLQHEGWTLLEEFAFESAIKRMTSVYTAPTTYSSASCVALMKGAPERVIELCNQAYVVDAVESLDQHMRKQLAYQNEQMASQGLRVMALAIRTDSVRPGMSREEVERDMIFLGFVGIYDPPRAETSEAVQTCIDAGIVVHMVTGDHPATAFAIAKQVNIIPDGEGEGQAGHSTITARELDQMSQEEIDALPELPRVIARCSPDTKVKLIEALHRRKRFVAMTGDGVNDAPALKFADVGIAMGKNGSDVAREASDMILTDDNFSTIVHAIREGRRIFLNISKFISHLMTGNVAEVIALILGLTIMDATSRSVYILSPLQILWINMVTSSPPAMALGVEPAPRKVMQRPPHTAGLFTVEFLADTMVYGIIMGSITLLSFVFSLFVFKGGDIGVNCNTFGDESVGCSAVYESRSVPFILLSLMLLGHALNLKDKRKPIWRINHLNNKALLAAVAIGTAVTVPVIYIPTINHHVFVSDPISREWGIVGVGLLAFVVLGECYKACKRAWWPEHKEKSLGSVVKKGTAKIKRLKKNKMKKETKTQEFEVDIESQEHKSDVSKSTEEEESRVSQSQSVTSR
eukprot:TRINITY_DN302_c0_g1_i1.p1 TRINITY_DN302_c0_g1~~TRINITY_DN302_c0_g1_i1.p1  ORF type:complete len:1156 (+),score=270.27 TRINITY_DN302_c0_g1_i1:211-3678(+)